MTEQERIWCDNATMIGGSFVSAFAKACFNADDDNFALLRPSLKAIMEKYPKYLELGVGEQWKP